MKHSQGILTGKMSHSYPSIWLNSLINMSHIA